MRLFIFSLVNSLSSMSEGSLYCFNFKGSIKMNWCLYTTFLLSIIILKCEATCQMLKKSVMLYRVERILYRYVTCTNMTPSGIREGIISTLNSSSQYLEVTNSDLPEVTKDMFLYLNITQLTIEAGVQIVQEKAFEYTNASTITLDNNKIYKIKSNAFKSFSIYILNLQNNQLTQIENGSLAGVANLRKLNLQNNKISNIQLDAFKDLGNLEEINLGSNQLSAISYNTFRSLINVQTIYLNSNALKEVETNAFIKNKVLHNLIMNNNYLTYIDATAYPSTLTNLNVEENKISFINVSTLTNLNKLVLNSNRIIKLTNCLNSLPSLASLHINNNILDVNKIFDTFSRLSNLTILELDNNKISKFNCSILKDVHTLEGLSLADNNIQTIDFADMTSSIKLVNLSQNSLFEIKNLASIPNLLKLELSYNNLTEINFNTFENLTQLHSLWIHHNQIKSLTIGCFRSLKALTHLDISNNKILNITAGALNGLDGLTELNLSYNNISFLNEDIFHNMKTLRSLSIAHNNLTNVNVKGILTHTIWLREIDMNGNNWTCRLLINISRDNKLLTIKGGNFYNVSNIYGIPCREQEEPTEKYANNYKEGLAEIIASINATVNYTHDISIKLSCILSLIMLIILAQSLKYIISKYSPQITASRQFVYQKSTSEGEIHLI